jgi:beta-phosphoglucomutase-like phosphatase (HAD superfamily)
MSERLPKYCDSDGAAKLLTAIGSEFAVVENPTYIFPRFDLYPLAPKRDMLERGLAGAVMDMDGTTTTTEPLCIHSLETMVRRVTGNAANPDWPGLNQERDYPHIIGNSTTRHIEYLLDTYAGDVETDALRYWHVYAAAWTLGKAEDEGRRREVHATLSALGAGALKQDARFAALCAAGDLNTPDAGVALTQLADEMAHQYCLDTKANRVRAAIDVYYQRYHEILAAIAAGNGDAIAREVLHEPGAHLIEPMPGIGAFLAMLKGWLGEELSLLAPLLGTDTPEAGGTLAALGRHFAAHPAKVAIVTSSIAYEARIVLGEVFRLLAGQAAQWPVPSATRDIIVERFRDPALFYDAMITASDSSEIRLKPHRDLYSLALHQLGLHPRDFDRVAGFEDSESGTIAIRASGIGLCCALPFTMTRGHAFEAASHVCRGGIPEVMTDYNVFLALHLLEATAR